MDGITPLIQRGLLWAAAPGGVIPEDALNTYLPRQGSFSFPTASENPVSPVDQFQGYRLLDPESAFGLATSARALHEKNHRIVAPFRVPQIDEALPVRGLEFGALHEFIGGGNESQRIQNHTAYSNTAYSNTGYSNRPQAGQATHLRQSNLPSYPLTVISHLAYNGWEAALPHDSSYEMQDRRHAKDTRSLQQSLGTNTEGELSNASTRSLTGERKNRAKLILWIGRSVWPTPSLLWEISRHNPKHQKLLFENMFFVNPRTPAEHLWALETALRSSQVAVVVSSLEQVTGTMMRRLALAARRGNTLGILARTVRAYSTFLISQSRWSVQPYLASGLSRRERSSGEDAEAQAASRCCWQITLERCKGCVATPLSWILEEHREFHAVRNDAVLNKAAQGSNIGQINSVGQINTKAVINRELSHNLVDKTDGDFEALSLRIPPELVNNSRAENPRQNGGISGPFGATRTRERQSVTRTTSAARTAGGKHFNIA